MQQLVFFCCDILELISLEKTSPYSMLCFVQFLDPRLLRNNCVESVEVFNFTQLLTFGYQWGNIFTKPFFPIVFVSIAR